MRRINDMYQVANALVADDYSASRGVIDGMLKANETNKHTYSAYFASVGSFLVQMMDHDQALNEAHYFRQSYEVLQDNNRQLYQDILQENYDRSFVNPTYACDLFGHEMGQFLSTVAYMFRDYVGLVYESRYFELNRLNQLFIDLYKAMVEEDISDLKVLIQVVKDFRLKDLEQQLDHEWLRKASPDFDVYSHIVDDYDLTDYRYLFRYGMYVGTNELLQAKHIMTLSDAQQQRIADTYTEAYIRGFKRNNVSLDHKKSLLVTYHIGFEMIMKKAYKNFRAIGLEPFAFYALRGQQRPRLYNTKPNRQMEYDHRFSNGLFVDEAYVKAYHEALKGTLKKYEQSFKAYSGLALFEVFGQAPFAPVNHEANVVHDEEVTALSARLNRETALEVGKYLPKDAYSFTINDYPLPSIGHQYKEIFNATIDVNTLDEPVYEKIQSVMIDALDQCNHVVVTGRNGNETDIRVSLRPIKDASSETIFHNCTADVNVPVGEVYTSPVLKGTEGLLHVQKIFLQGFEYTDLKIWFKDGMITDYTCGNFEEEEANRNFVQESLMHPHDTLPLGEFAIGTNTVAYMMAKKFDIQDQLPILIGEKTGPHFAIGDTCFVMSEDTPVYNSNGKEVIARDNEKTCQRVDNAEEAYTYKHTDITIPYNELDTIIGYNNAQEPYELIRNGRFVLEGTTLLNQPFDEE